MKLAEMGTQRAATAPERNSDRWWDICNTAGRFLDRDHRESAAGAASPEVALAALSAETSRSCAACQTLHGAIRTCQRREHSGQRPRGPGVWVARRARHPWVRRGNSLRTADSSDPLSALLASSSSMSSRSHTASWRIWPRTRSTSPPFFGSVRAASRMPRMSGSGISGRESCYFRCTQLVL